jgi:hypothetical protein
MAGKRRALAEACTLRKRARYKGKTRFSLHYSHISFAGLSASLHGLVLTALLFYSILVMEFLESRLASRKATHPR